MGTISSKRTTHVWLSLTNVGSLTIQIHSLRTRNARNVSTICISTLYLIHVHANQTKCSTQVSGVLIRKTLNSAQLTTPIQLTTTHSALPVRQPKYWRTERTWIIHSRSVNTTPCSQTIWIQWHTPKMECIWLNSRSWRSSLTSCTIWLHTTSLLLDSYSSLWSSFILRIHSLCACVAR